MAKRWMLVIDEYEGIVKNAVNMLSGYLSGMVSYILPVKYTRDMTEHEYAENNIIAVGKGKTHSISSNLIVAFFKTFSQ